MRPEKVAMAALAALVGGLIVGGIVAVGGPAKGRIETRDRVRLSDLDEISRFVRCAANAGATTLPDSLEPVETCQRDMRLSDPYTDAAYVYEKVSPNAYRLCAGFEDPKWIAQHVRDNLESATGCIRFTYFP